jgi:hypothetical protein
MAEKIECYFFANLELIDQSLLQADMQSCQISTPFTGVGEIFSS